MITVIPRNGETWLICGGRDFADNIMLRSALADIVSMRGCPDRVVHGGAKGADSLAGCWAKEKAVPVHKVEADWSTHGKAAGPIRNQKMLDDYQPDCVIAFPGGRGTQDMVRRAHAVAGLDVIEIKPN